MNLFPVAHGDSLPIQRINILLKPNRRNEPFALRSLLSAKIEDLNVLSDPDDLNDKPNKLKKLNKPA